MMAAGLNVFPADKSGVEMRGYPFDAARVPA